MSGLRSWMLYGAAGHTGALIAQHANQRGHWPLLADRNAPAITALAERLDLPHRALALDDPAALNAALADVDLVRIDPDLPEVPLPATRPSDDRP